MRIWRDISLSNEIPTLKRLSKSVDKISTLLSNDKVIEFVKMMEDIGFSVPIPRELDSLNLSPSKRYRLSRYLEEIRDNGDLRAVTLALLELSKVDGNLPIEVCWTCPSENPHIRMTWPALSEIILDAKESILIMGYAINTNMERIMEYLEEKSKEGVKLVFMIDRVGEKKDFLQRVKKLHPPLEIYDRPEEPSDPLSALHVKCVIVDGRIAMFGSANLTYHGMKGNIELGLVVKDERTVRKIVHLIMGIKNDLVKIDLNDI